MWAELHPTPAGWQMSQTPQAWNEQTLAALEDQYLSATDVRRGSGFRGDADRWTRGRHPIVEAIDRSGAFLDVGCANGLLLESVVDWAAARGHRIEAHGLELSAALASFARDRLPDLADRIHVGDVMTWQPPRRYDFVRTELVYVRPSDRADLIRRCLDTIVADGGRLIVCAYGSGQLPVESPGETLRQWGFPVTGASEGRDVDGRLLTGVAWIDRAVGV